MDDQSIQDMECKSNGIDVDVESTAIDDSGFPGILPLCDVQEGHEISPLGLKISNVTSLNPCQNEVEMKPEVLKPSSIDESLQQLSTNALPPYTPSSFPVSLQNCMPLETYCCTDCGDTFVVKSSLTFHLHRKSVKITFMCDTCNNIQIFYNRCSLLSHIRAHKDKGEESDVRNAFVKPIEILEFMELSMGHPPSDEEDAVTAAENAPVSVTKLLEVSMNESNVEPSISINTAASSSVEETPSVASCCECGKIFESPELRTSHLTNNDEIPPVISQCQRCGILCPSRCNFKAHLRVHMKVKPYVCPECGVLYGQSWDSFFRHLNYECFHFSRSMGYKCCVCNHLLGSSPALQRHTLNLHTETYVKCQACPMAFKSLQSFQNHKTKTTQTQHTCAEAIHKLIFKCALCDIVFLTKEQMMSHLDFHIKDQLRQYVFNCMECNKAIDSKVALYEHLQIFHQKSAHVKSLNFDSLAPGGKQINLDANGQPLFHPEKVDCILCRLSFTTRQAYNIHNAKVHSHSKHHCAACGLITDSKYDMIKHGKRHMKRGCILCLLCDNKKFSHENLLLAHLSQHIENINFPSYCPLCDFPLYNLAHAAGHLKKEHAMEMDQNVIKKVLPSKGTANSSSSDNPHYCQPCRQSFANWNEWKQHILSKHRLKPNSKDSVISPILLTAAKQDNNSKGNSESVKRKFSESLIPEGSNANPKHFKNSGYSCTKCDFVSEEKEAFKDHILSHKASKSSFQCQDCGSCFVVESSLRRHLKAIHKISDIDKYITEEGTNYTPEIETPSESSNHSSLECNVCYTIFPSEASLKTHLRSHGMAFIQAKKTLVSAKSNV